MKYLDIPILGKKASRVAFGAGNVDFARRQECINMMNVFTEQGGNVFDTANIYGKWLESGTNESEIILGEWLHEKIQVEKCINREEIVISTKGAHPDLNTMENYRMSYEDINADLEESLKSLKLDYVDIYWLHRDAPTLSVDYILDTLIKLRKTEKIRLFGFSNWSADRTSRAINYLKSLDELDGFFGMQNRWSLASMNPEGSEDKTMVAMNSDEYTLLSENKFFEMPYSAMGKGYFVKLQAMGKENLSPNLLKYYDNKLNDSRMKAINELSEKYRRPVSQLTLAFMFNHPFPVIPIFRSSNIEQLQDAIASVDISLSKADMEFLGQGVPY